MVGDGPHERETQQLVISVVNNVIYEDENEKQLAQRKRQVDLFKQGVPYYRMKKLECRDAPDYYVQWLMDGPEISLRLSKRQFWHQVSKWKKHIHMCNDEGKVVLHRYRGNRVAPFV